MIHLKGHLGTLKANLELDFEFGALSVRPF